MLTHSGSPCLVLQQKRGGGGVGVEACEDTVGWWWWGGHQGEVREEAYRDEGVEVKA